MNKKPKFALFILCLALAGLAAELALRLAGFAFTPPPLRPPCLAAGSCGEAKAGLFENRRGTLSLKPEYYGWFNPQSFPARKPAGEYRVFLFGGSTVYNLYGDTSKPFSEGGRNVRVINLGGNSFGLARLMPVFREALEYDPDLVLFYSGHNEFVDVVLGAMDDGDGGREKRAAKLRASRLYSLAEFAVYKAGMALMRLRKSGDTGLVRRFSVHLPEGTNKDKVYARYRGNLRAAAAEARARGVAVRFCTLAYNRFIPPVSPPEAVETHRKGLELAAAGRHGEALALLNRGHEAEAIPYGANETINRIIRETAAETGVPLIDVDAAVSAVAPNGIPGFETFNDQCHYRDNDAFWAVLRGAIALSVGSGR